MKALAMRKFAARLRRFLRNIPPQPMTARMTGFVKIYGSILDSSIWSTDLATRVVWVTLLAMADRHGVVTASIDGIARRANVPIEDATRALEVLKSPDDYSKSRAFSGRRIRPVDSGFLILNYAKYRELQTESQVHAAERARRYREKHKESVTRHASNAPSHEKTPEAEAKAEADTTTTRVQSSVLPHDDQVFCEAWSAYPKRPNNSRGAAWRQWLARVKEGVDPLDMLEGTRRYAKYLEANPPSDRTYIKLASTFYGRDRHFESDFTPSPPRDQRIAAIESALADDEAAEARTQQLLKSRGVA